MLTEILGGAGACGGGCDACDGGRGASAPGTERDAGAAGGRAEGGTGPGVAASLRQETAGAVVAAGIAARTAVRHGTVPRD